VADLRGSSNSLNSGIGHILKWTTGVYIFQNYPPPSWGPMGGNDFEGNNEKWESKGKFFHTFYPKMYLFFPIQQIKP